MLVLASASPRRRALLGEADIEFEVLPVDVDETPPPDLPPEEVVIVLAGRKARAAAALTGRRPVVGADTIVVLDGAILGKPASDAEAASTLSRLSGRSHVVLTGICVIPAAPAVPRTCAVATGVTFRELTPGEIDAYVATGEPRDKAGSYGIQGEAGNFVAKVDGSRSNVIGLPVETLREMLEP